MKKKIKIFASSIRGEVEDDVNEFISTVRVADIKFSTSEKLYEIMVIYYDNDE